MQRASSPTAGASNASDAEASASIVEQAGAATIAGHHSSSVAIDIGPPFLDHRKHGTRYANALGGHNAGTSVCPGIGQITLDTLAVG